MTDLVAASNWWAALYLLAWILIGHFIVLTLFLAVILEAFESMYDATTGKDLIIAELETNKAQQPGHVASLADDDSSKRESSVDSDFFVEYMSRQRFQVLPCPQCHLLSGLSFLILDR